MRAVVVQGRRQGSGVILNRRLVLTCAHVIEEPPDTGQERVGTGRDGDRTSPQERYAVIPYEAALAAQHDGGPAPRADLVVTHPVDAPAPRRPDVTVVHPDTGPVTCSLAWIDHEQDAAVLYAAADLPFTTHVRTGRLDTHQPLPDCQIIGYPEVQRRARRVACDQFTGTVLPVAGRPGTGLTFAFDQLPAEPPADIREVRPRLQGPFGTSSTGPGKTLLAGLSGAPVFAGEVLLGIVTHIPRARFQLRAEGTAVVDLRDLPYDLPGSEPITEHITADTSYEAEYAAAVESAYRRTKVFGLDDLNRRESEWDLDIAYLSLEAEASQTRRMTGAAYTAAGAQHGLVEDFASGARSTSPKPAGQAPQRIDALLSTRPRVLLRGDAGAGKTTLVWWLAAHVAMGTLGPRLAELNGLVPFVVPLRTVRAQDGAFPTPAGLPRTARLMIDSAPGGWATRVLRAGRALLLVDGLDEVPGADREEAQQWLAALLRRFPETRCVATVRPLAVEPDWLATEGFEELRLLPMRDDDIQTFVASWHRAARQDGDDIDHIHELERDLLRQFQLNHTLRDLARTPLLCAVICALHRKRQGFLPETRFRLYQSALEMLLGNRDVRRRVGTPDGIDMSVEEHHQILQRFAVWLVRCGQLELTREQAAPQLESALSGMARVREQGSAEDILTHLRNRSGLLQERADDSFQFIHRTFQDFLAAKEFVEGGYLGELVRNAAEAQWRDVVLLAAGHCGRREIHELLVGLLDRADGAGTSAEFRTGLYVLAARCSEHASWLEQEVAERLRQRVRTLVPPSDSKGVLRLINLGPYVLPLLPPPQKLDDAQTNRITNVLCGIGGADAIPYARRLAKDAPDYVRESLALSWKNFPTEEYAREILCMVDLSRETLLVTSAQQCAQLYRLPRPHSIDFEGDLSSTVLGRAVTSCRRVSVQKNGALTNLAFLHDWQRRNSTRPKGPLDWLRIDDCPELRDVSAVASTALDSLLLDARCLPNAALAPLGDIPGLRRLRLYDLAVERVRDLAAHSGVQQLRLHTRRELDLVGLDRWESLTDLAVLSPLTPAAQLLAHLRGAPRISSATTIMPTLSALLNQPAVPHLTSLVLQGVKDWTHLPMLPEVFPALTSLALDLRPELPRRLDLRPLNALPDLQVKARIPVHPAIDVVGGERYGIVN